MTPDRTLQCYAIAVAVALSTALAVQLVSGLVSGDIRHGIDYRSLYATAAQNWWGLARASSTLGDYPPLPLLKV